MELCWQTTANSKGNKCQTQQVARVSLTLTSIQRLMRENKAGLLPPQTAYVAQRGRFISPALTVWCLWPWNRLIIGAASRVCFGIYLILPRMMGALRL